MKTTILKILASIFLLAAISACDGKDDNPKPDSEKEKEDEKEKSKSILADNSIFFFVIDGIRYDTNTKIQEILDDGYTLYSSSDMTREVGAGKNYGTVRVCRGNDWIFQLYAINKTNKALTIPECTPFTIILHASWYDKVTIYGDLTFGSTIEEVEKLFVGEISSKTTRKDREEMLGEGFGGDNDVVITYGQSAYSTEGRMRFEFDDAGKLADIRLESNSK